MIRVAICDDNVSDLARLRTMLEGCGLSLTITDYACGENLLWDVETEKARFDIYLLDIYLEGISGVEAARRIRAKDGCAALIFVSSSDSYYRDAFDLFATNYLIKPLKQTALNTVMMKAAEGIRRQRDLILPITYRGCTYVLKQKDIEYISSSNRMLSFYMVSGEEHVCYGKMDQITAQLKSGDFVRCHQSYIINLRYVLERTSNGLLIGNTVIPISRSYAEEAEAAVNRYLFSAFDSI